MHSGISNYANDPASTDTATAATPDNGSSSSGLHEITDNLERSVSVDQDDEQTKKKKGAKRRKVNHACLYCRRSHMTCDEGRPCQRCIKREIGHLCHDERRPSAKEKEKNTTPQPQPQPVAPTTTTTATPNHTVEVARPTIPGNMNMTPQNAFLYQPETLGNEFSVLSDFLESLDEGSFFSQAAVSAPLMNTSPYANPVTLGVDNNSYMTAAPTSTTTNTEPIPPPPEKPSDEPAPIVLPAPSKTERFFLTAADQTAGSRNERLNMVIRSKYEAGLLKPYNYVKGYARLSRWMDKNVSQESKQKILQPLSVLRPKFRSIAQSESLTDIDLVFIEEAFERLLLDYDRVFSAMAIPACLWRRTGEIYKANREFAELVGVDNYMLRDGRLCIYELMAEDSAKYGHVAFDSNQKAVLTTCVLRLKPVFPASGSNTPASNKLKLDGAQEEGFISCCFSFTIRRDPYGIPTLIVGNFIRC
ncbi:hypothetical protein C8Q75DRAFT_720391 [Abortiporus biennis]|nr:hypothetical protein C8Q75DRAFT_720391 [Abortiporus biennis]